jgi:hypothetical protein
MHSNPSGRADRAPSPLRNSCRPYILPAMYHPGYSSPCSKLPNTSLISETEFDELLWPDLTNKGQPVQLRDQTSGAFLTPPTLQRSRHTPGERRACAETDDGYERCPCSRPSPTPRPRPEQTENSASHVHTQYRSFVARQGEDLKTSRPSRGQPIFPWPVTGCDADLAWGATREASGPWDSRERPVAANIDPDEFGKAPGRCRSRLRPIATWVRRANISQPPIRSPTQGPTSPFRSG